MPGIRTTTCPKLCRVRPAPAPRSRDGLPFWASTRPTIPAVAVERMMSSDESRRLLSSPGLVLSAGPAWIAVCAAVSPCPILRRGLGDHLSCRAGRAGLADDIWREYVCVRFLECPVRVLLSMPTGFMVPLWAWPLFFSPSGLGVRATPLAQRLAALPVSPSSSKECLLAPASLRFRLLAAIHGAIGQALLLLLRGSCAS